MVLEDGRPEERARHTGRIMVISNIRFLAAMVLEDGRPEERARHTGRIMVISNIRFLAAMVIRSFGGKCRWEAMAHGLRKILGDLLDVWSLLHQFWEDRKAVPPFSDFLRCLRKICTVDA